MAFVSDPFNQFPKPVAWQDPWLTSEDQKALAKEDRAEGTK